MAEDKVKKKPTKTSSSKGKTSKRTKSPTPEKNSTASSVKDLTRDDDRSIVITADNILDVLPLEFQRYDGNTSVDPSLYYLPKQANVNSGNKFPNFRVYLGAAEDDVRLHRARLQAAKNGDLSLLRKYQLETDPAWLSRQQRLNERELMLSKLDMERPLILKELLNPPTGLTQEESTQVQLARWQRALELYVYSPNDQDKLGMLELLEQLSEGVAEVRPSVNNALYTEYRPTTSTSTNTFSLTFTFKRRIACPMF